MKNLIYFAMGILFAISLQAQTQIQNTFMTSIDPNNEHRSNNGVIIMDNGDGFMIVSASICDQNTIGCLDLIKTDYNGVPLWSNNFIKYPYGLGVANDGLIKKQEGDFLLLAGEGNITNGYNVFTALLNQDGDSISSFPIGENVIAIANHGIWEGNNNDYITLYTSGIQQVTGYAVLQQVFADGTLGWSKIFAPTNYTNGISLGKMYDNGFVLGLSVFDFNNPDNFRADIVRTTGTGDTLWSKWLPTIDPDYAPLLQVLVQANHNIAAAWAIDTFLYVPGEGLYNQYPPTVFCLSESGEILWKYPFMNLYPKTINSIRTAANGDIIGCGITGYGMGLLFRLSPTGELLWEHGYSNSHSANPYFPLFDLVETHEGNIAATGVVMTDIGQQGAIDNDIGLLLVDANGCVEGSCEDTIYLSVANEGQAWHNLSKPRFVVSPNPVGNQTTLLYQLPPNTQNAQLALLIYDVFGRQIAKYTLPEQQQNFTFNTANLPNGIYVYTVLAKGQRIYTNKFVKQ